MGCCPSSLSSDTIVAASHTHTPPSAAHDVPRSAVAHDAVQVRVAAAHPGWTRTDLQRDTPLFRFLGPALAMTPPQGALPTLRAALDPDVEAGAYYGPNGLLEMRGSPELAQPTRRARSEEDGQKLWEVSEELTGVRFLTPAAV